MARSRPPEKHRGGYTVSILTESPNCIEHGTGAAVNAGGTFQKGCQIMPVARPKPTHDDWVKTVLFDRGYLSRIPGDAIKVYLAIIEACGGVPDRSVTISLRLLMQRTELSCPTVIESLSRLESLGLVVSTTRQRGKVKTYYVSDPPAA